MPLQLVPALAPRGGPLEGPSGLRQAGMPRAGAVSDAPAQTGSGRHEEAVGTAGAQPARGVSSGSTTERGAVPRGAIAVAVLGSACTRAPPI